MGSMLVQPREGAWTVDDLDELPDDGLQYELADGLLLVTPSPRPFHQRMTSRLMVLLSKTCPEDLEAFVAPLDVRFSRKTSLQPDVLVVRKQDVGEDRIMGIPLLVVEVLSPATRAKDLILKRALYAEGGVPSYWVLDPSEPSITVLQLVGDEYREAGRVSGAEQLEVTEPFPVLLEAEALIR